MIEIRPTTLADGTLLGALEQRIFIEEAWPAEDVAELLEVQHVFGAVALDDGVAVGYTLVQAVPGQTGDILTIGVVPEMRQKGVASQLLNFIFERAAAQRVAEIYLEVRQSNVAAHKFYEKHGARMVGKRPDYYKATENIPKEDALVFVFDIPTILVAHE